MEHIEIHVRLPEEILYSWNQLLNSIRKVLSELDWVLRSQTETLDNAERFRKKHLNRAIAELFKQEGWKKEYELCKTPELFADFYKEGVLVEVQFELKFGLYGDIYKFQYASHKKESALNVFIIMEEYFNTSDGKGKPNAFNHNRVVDLLSMDYFTFPVVLFVLTPDPYPIN